MTEQRSDSADAQERSIAVSSDGETALPLSETVMGRAFITGKSGSGKSNSVGVLVEGVLDRGIPTLVIDSEGEYSGLAEQYNALHAGASPNCDVQITTTAAARVADTVCERHVPVVLDTSAMVNDEDRHELVGMVARRLFERQQRLQHPMLVIIEECHEYLPQRGSTDATDHLLQLAKRGRKRGLGLIGVSQRPADVEKAFVTQCDWQVWHKLTWKNDLNVVADHLDSETAAMVEDLDIGEAVIATDWSGECRRVQWRQKRTPDLGAAPSIDRAVGSTPDHIGTDVINQFQIDHGMDVTLPEAGRACLEHLVEVIAGLDTEERYILDYVYQADDAIDPKPAYELAGGNPDSQYVYEKLRTLREATLIAKEGRGVYSYALPDRVRSHLRFHGDVEQRHIGAIVERLEADFAGIAESPDEPDETLPTPGDTLGTYCIHANGTDGGYAQLGKPVTKYLGVGSDESVAITPLTDRDSPCLTVTSGDDGELTYATFEHKDYAAFTLGARGIAALDVAAGDRVEVTAASDQMAHITVAEAAKQ
jgi:hypothetical protein